MARRSTPMAIDAGDRAPATVSDDDRSPTVVRKWYARGASVIWWAANLLAVAICAGAGWDYVPRSVVVAWLLFTTLNATLYLAIACEFSSWFPYAVRESDAVQRGMAFIFGVGWGACILAAAPVLDRANLVSLIASCVFVALSAVPVFAPRRGALPLFTLPLGAAAAVGFGASAHLEFVVPFVVLVTAAVLVIAAIYVKFTRAAVTAMTEIIEVDHGDGPIRKGNFPQLVERRIGAIRRLHRGQHRATAVLDAIGEAVITTNEAGLIDYMNPVAEVLTGISFDVANGQRIERVVDLRSNSASNSVAALIDRSKSTGRVDSSGDRSVLRRCDGVEYDVEFQVCAIRGNRDEFSGTSCLVRDVTAKRSLTKDIVWRSTHDPLTKLINRTEFEDRLRQMLARGGDPDKRHALCYVDFDQFKFVNEAYGVDAGNHVLQSIALELKQRIRGADTLARIGEDKFGVILYSCPIDKAKLIAEGLRRIVEKFHTDWDDFDLSVSVSIGVFEINPRTDELTDILSGAEAACDYAKEGGGNRTQVFYAGTELRRRRGESSKRLREIQSAIRTNRLELYFQRILAVGNNGRQPHSCELLLRMRGSAGEPLSPRENLVAAERYHLMPALDRWVAKAALDALRINHPALRGMGTVGIGVSGQSINDDRFLEFLSELLDDEFDRGRICFNISHASLISNVDRARFFIVSLKDLGCRVALDDFGLGMSSSELLKRLQIDYLKIGADLVGNMAYSSADYEIVLALARIAKTLRIETIAEGVATLGTKESLMNMGVDYLQGPVIDESRPIAIVAKTITH